MFGEAPPKNNPTNVSPHKFAPSAPSVCPNVRIWPLNLCCTAKHNVRIVWRWVYTLVRLYKVHANKQERLILVKLKTHVRGWFAACEVLYYTTDKVTTSKRMYHLDWRNLQIVFNVFPKQTARNN